MALSFSLTFSKCFVSQRTIFYLHRRLCLVYEKSVHAFVHTVYTLFLIFPVSNLILPRMFFRVNPLLLFFDIPEKLLSVNVYM